MKDWKTTSAGILAIVSALVAIIYAATTGNVSSELIVGAVTGILAGIGLLFAKDTGTS